MFSANDIKKKVGEYASQLVKDNMTIGIGTGSTAYWFTLSVAERVQQGLQIKAVPTSQATKELAAEKGISLVELDEISFLDLTVDGADEVDHQLQLIKGGGGALLQEKIVAAASRQLIIIADESKYVNYLGAFPLPVEVITFGWKHVWQHIEKLSCEKIILRMKNDQPFITDHGHYILDCYFEKITDAAALNISLHQIPGVVETGLFINMATTAIIGYENGHIETITNKV